MPNFEIPQVPVPEALGELSVSMKQYRNPVQDVVEPAWTEEVTEPVLDEDGNDTGEVAVVETIEHDAVLGDPRHGTVSASFRLVDADGNAAGTISGDTSQLTDGEKEALIKLAEGVRARVAAATGLAPR